MITVFIDSSVLFSAALSATGASAEIIRRGLRADIALAISDVVLEDYLVRLDRGHLAGLPEVAKRSKLKIV
jgi:predicted nucleic acid-binding protein